MPMQKYVNLPPNFFFMRTAGITLLFCYLLICPAVAVFSSEPGKPYPNSRFAVVDSGSIHYRVWNEHLAHPRGKVLLIHGFCGSTFCWRNNYDTLIAAGYKIVAIDLPGFGYSQRSASMNQSQSNRGRIIWKLLEEIDGRDTTKWNIVGHSMGGGTAEAVALMNPGRTKSLAILDGMVFIKNGNLNAGIVALVHLPLYKKILLSYYKHYYLSFNNFRRELKGTYGFLPDTVTVRGYWTPLQIEGTNETIVNLLANSTEIQSLDAKELGHLPVLVIWGEKDRTIGLREGKKLKKAVPSIELRVIPNARHMAMETHPEIFNAMLVGFLNRNN